MAINQSINDLLATVPYLPPHRIGVEMGEQGVVGANMPFRREVTNYVGTVHAGALFTLAETAAGVAAHGVVPGGRAFILLRGAEIRYTRRAEADVAASARAIEKDAEAARAAFDADNRAEIPIAVTITDADGETVFEGNFDYSIRPVPA